MPSRASRLVRPERLLFGWIYGGRWYWRRETVAYCYWLDLVTALGRDMLERDLRMDEIEIGPRVTLPEYREILDSLQ